MDSRQLFADKSGFEQWFRGSKALFSDIDDLSIRQFVGFVILSRMLKSWIKNYLPAISAPQFRAT